MAAGQAQRGPDKRQEMEGTEGGLGTERSAQEAREHGRGPDPEGTAWVAETKGRKEDWAPGGPCGMLRATARGPDPAGPARAGEDQTEATLDHGRGEGLGDSASGRAARRIRRRRRARYASFSTQPP